jgi:hypothetical protein
VKQGSDPRKQRRRHAEKQQSRRLREKNQDLRTENEALRKQSEALRKQNEALREEKERLEQENRRLQDRVEELQRAALRPAAPYRRELRNKVAPEKKKRPGRKPGHAGSFRPVPEHVDEKVEVPLQDCPQCGGTQLQDVQPVVQYIEEVPPVRPLVVKVTTWQATCLTCGPVQSLHPLQTSTAQGAAKVQLGPRALALGAMLNKAHGMTVRTTCRVLEDLVGLHITPGGLAQALQRVARKLQPEYEKLKVQLRHSAAAFADETSWWVGEPGWWLWVFTDPQTTLYRVDESRGSAVVREILGDDFQGVLVSDCLSSYDPPEYRKHKCIAHHFKAIAAARDSPESRDSSYLDEWSLFFKTVIAVHALCLEEGSQAHRQVITRLEAWRDRLLDHTPRQPGELAVHNRLDKQRAHLLGCLEEPAAEPTNNRAERALRPAVIARKLSCGNKTLQGKQAWEILTSLAATCRQRDLDLVELLASRMTLAPTR